MKLTFDELKEFLDEKHVLYNQHYFIETDPIQIPHQFTKKEDIEIAGLLTSLIAWGQRKTIIKNAQLIMQTMECQPFDFVSNHSDNDLSDFNLFKHRTMNGEDLKTIIKGLKHIYTTIGLEELFKNHSTQNSTQPAISAFKRTLLEIPHEKRVEKHIADPQKGSAAKRINMFLRWMIRRDQFGVDFGIWKSISPSILSCPLDVHTAKVGRKLNLIQRKQNDHKTVLELDNQLRKLDPKDPVKYDFALFGLGAFENFC